MAGGLQIKVSCLQLVFRGRHDGLGFQDSMRGRSTAVECLVVIREQVASSGSRHPDYFCRTVGALFCDHSSRHQNQGWPLDIVTVSWHGVLNTDPD